MQERSRDARARVSGADASESLVFGGAGPTARARTLTDAHAFLKGFLAHPAQVGSVVPSSAALERRLIEALDLSAARTVVELGPGTGGTTRALLRALPSDAKLLAIELSADFHARLSARLRDPRLILQLGSAEHLLDLLRDWRLPAPDAIVSGIPFSTMPREVAERIAAAIAQALAPGGRFVAYQFRADVVRYIRPHLGEPHTEWEWINIPPMRVFRWVKPR